MMEAVERIKKGEMDEVTAYIALGSNVGDRHAAMREAVRRLLKQDRASV